MLNFHETGRWRPGQIQVEWVASTWPTDNVALNARIERAWQQAKRRLGERLFDGPMCRMESWHRDDSTGILRLRLSKTSYRIFLGTNLSLNDAGPLDTELLANPVGVSPALVSSDNHLMLGRRNASVAYYPNRLHPFAGALEPRPNVDPFDEIRRELHEELSLTHDDVHGIVCTGIVEDVQLRQPELIFAARTSLSRDQIRAQVHDEEHHESWSVPATPDAIERALLTDPAALPFTPVARAAMLLFGRIEFGQAWFDRLRPLQSAAG